MNAVSGIHGQKPETDRLLDWFEPEEGRLVGVREHVQEPVGALSHIADALPQLGKHPFTPLLLSFAVEDDALQVSVFRIIPVLSDPTNRFRSSLGNGHRRKTSFPRSD